MSKYLYNFTENKTVEVEKIEESTNENNELVKTIKKVKEEKPFEFAIRKPNRAMTDDAELFYGVKLAEGIKAGMLTRTLMVKKYDKDGGIFTEGEVEKIKILLEELTNVQIKYQVYVDKEDKKEELTQQEKEEKNKLEAQVNALRLELIELENTKNNIFEQTAENRAKNKTMMWWILFLSYKKEGDNYTPLFGEGTYEQRIKKYDEIEEGEDEFLKNILTKFAYFVSFWYSGKAAKPEDFKVIEDYLKEQGNQT
jgi:hypothetical protein